MIGPLTLSSRLMLILVVALNLGPPGRRPLTDEELLVYAKSSYDRRAMEGHQLDLGDHNGVRVFADFPCADLCPLYTTRIIQYDVTNEADCPNHGGVVRAIDTPAGTGLMSVPYCIPRILDEHWAEVRQ